MQHNDPVADNASPAEFSDSGAVSGDSKKAKAKAGHSGVNTLESESSVTTDGGKADSDHKTKKKKKKNKKKAGRVLKTASGITTSRGVETMFRSSYRVQMDLTALADSKANIMITINGLILSIILASISPKIDTNVFLVIPTTVVLLTCVVSIVFAVLAAVPRISSSTVTLADVQTNQANLLFFGNFSGLMRSEYVDIMKEVLKDPDRVYHNMLNDIYGMGIVLKRKFSLLRIAYVTFMFGIIISVAVFVVVFILQAVNGAPPATSIPG